MNRKSIIIFLLSLFGSQLPAQNSLIFTGSTKLTVNSNTTVEVKGGVKTSGTASFVNDGAIYISGDINNESGEFQEVRKGVIVLNGSDQQKISGNPTFNELHIDNPSGVQVTSGSMRIYHTLYLDNGQLQTGDSLIFNSDAIRTARLAEVGGGSLSGDIIMECFIDSTAYAWRFLSLPVQNASASEWMDDFITTGISGSHYPSFPFQSVLSYDESVAGEKNNGFVAPNTMTTIIDAGKGVNVYTGNANLTVDAKGAAYTGDFDFGITYTDDATTASIEEGWNLIGNPYPSAIDWNATDWTKNNIDDAIYIYSGDQGQYTSYVGGVGTNGGSQFIASSQSFWIKANSPNPNLIAKETVKTSEDPNFIENVPNDVLRLRLSGATASDETVIRFNSTATDEFDEALDAIKFFSTDAVPSLATQWDSLNYSILSLPDGELSYEIPLYTSVVHNGLYSFTFTELPQGLSACYFQLYDRKLDSVYSIALFQNIVVSLDSNDASDRFLLFGGAGVELEISNNACSGDQQGAIELTPNLKGDWHYQLLDSTNSIVNSGNAASLQTLRVTNLSSGKYTIQLLHTSVCDTVTLPIELTEPSPLILSSNQVLDSIQGGFWLTANVSGGIAPYTYHWSDSLFGNLANVYTASLGLFDLIVTDSLGCTIKHQFNLTTVKIKEFEQALEFKVYPNPTNGVIKIESDLNNYELNLYGVDGRQLINQQASLMTSIDLSAYASGVYFVEIRKGGLIKRKRLVVID